MSEGTGQTVQQVTKRLADQGGYVYALWTLQRYAQASNSDQTFLDALKSL